MEDSKNDRVGELAAKLTGQSDTSGSADDQASGYQIMGGAMGVIGLLVTGYALFAYDATAPYSDTLNMGRLNEQLMLTITGCALFLAGTTTFAVGAIIRRL